MRHAALILCFACCWSTTAFAQYAPPYSPFEPGGLLDDGPEAPSVPDAPHSPPPPAPVAVKPTPDPRIPERSIWAEGKLNLGLPFLGAAVDYQPVSYFALNLGVGTNGHGLQLAIMPRARLRLGGSWALGFGAGYSTGPYAWDNAECALWDGCDSGAVFKKWDRAHWANFELSLETHRTPSGKRFYIGRSSLLNASPSSCDVDHSGTCSRKQFQDSGDAMYYIGIAIAFGTSL